MRVDNEGWEDVRPKAAVAANTGAGPDIILSTNDDANLYPDKLLDVTDLAEYLGKKYGGWYPACEAFLRPTARSGSASRSAPPARCWSTAKAWSRRPASTPSRRTTTTS